MEVSPAGAAPERAPAVPPRSLPKLESALRLAAEGFWVFPILPWPLGDEASAGKTPAVKFKEWATRDPETIRSWWGNTRPKTNKKHGQYVPAECNIGIFTEKFRDDKSLLALDVDNKKGKRGDDELIRLEIEGFDLPLTREQRTAGSGRHLIFIVDHPVKPGANVTAPGHDIRSYGGFIVAAGSTIGGTPYMMDDCPLAPAPQWLIDRCGQPRAKERTTTPAPVAIDAKRAETRAIEYLRDSAPLATEGAAGDQTTFVVAARVKDMGLGEREALDVMLAHWNDRCSPPWSADELATKVRNAYAYGQEAPGAAAPEADFTPIETAAAGNAPAPKPSRFKPIRYADIRNLPPASWLVDRWLTENGLSVVYGPPKAGKTFFALDLALSIAAGRPFHGIPVKPGRVVYVTAENAPARVGERVEAWLVENRIDPAAIEDWELISTKVALDDPKAVAELIDAIPGGRSFVVVDTLARSMSGDENSQQDMSAAVAGCDTLRAATGAAVLLVHHEGKDKAKGLRGSTVLRGAIDTGIVMKLEGGHISAAVADQRDGEIPPTMHFELRQVLLDRIGRASAALVRSGDFTPVPIKTGSYAAKALDCLKDLIASEGETAPDALGLPEGKLVTRISKWRARMGQIDDVPSNPGSNRKAFARARENLAAGHIEEIQDFVWLQ